MTIQRVQPHRNNNASAIAPPLVLTTGSSNSSTLTPDPSTKQDKLNGVGFVKANGTAISYDDSIYLTSVNVLSNGNSVGNVTAFNLSTGLTVVISGNTANINSTGGNGSGNGITSLNGQTATTQNFVGSSPIFINSSGGNHTFSIQYANSGNGGAITASDYNSFSNKQNQINFNATGEVTGAFNGSNTALSLNATGITAGNYTNPTINFDSKGRAIAAINGTIGGAFKLTDLPLIALWQSENLNSYTNLRSWRDSSGNGYHGDRSSDIPTGTGLNGYKSLVFSGTDRRLTIKTNVMDRLGKFFICVVFRSPVTPANLMSFFGSSVFSGGVTNILNLEYTGSTYPRTLLLRNALPDTSSEVTVTSSSSVAAANTWNYCFCYFDGTNIGIALNGGSYATAARTQSLGVASGFFIGGTNFAGAYLSGELLDLIFCNRNLTSTEETNLVSYLQTKYGGTFPL